MLHYIKTRKNTLSRQSVIDKPMKLSEFDMHDLDLDDDETSWKEKSRRMQIRRWRKISHRP